MDGKKGNVLIKIAEKMYHKIMAEIDLSLPQKSFFKHPDIDSKRFLKIAKKFLKEIMEILSNRKTFVWLCLLTSNRVSSFEEQSIFFENLKMIFVTRDPRDTFTSWTRMNWLQEKQVELFIKLYKNSHLDYPYNHNKVLNVRFEDFVLNHEETSQKILDFTGVSKDSKVDSPQYKVEDSRKNVGR